MGTPQSHCSLTGCDEVQGERAGCQSIVVSIHLTWGEGEHWDKQKKEAFAVLVYLCVPGEESVLTRLSSVAGQELSLALVPERPGHACAHNPERKGQLEILKARSGLNPSGYLGLGLTKTLHKSHIQWRWTPRMTVDPCWAV